MMDESQRRPPHYPVMLDVRGRRAVVLGEGPSARRAASGLAKHGADVVVISPDAPAELLRLEFLGEVTIEPRGYVSGDLEGAFIAIVAVDSEEIERAVVEEAEDRHVLVSVQRNADLSNFIVPSVVRRRDLQIAVSTEGRAPSVARQVRRGISEAHGWEWGVYTDLVAELRELAIARTGLTDADLTPLFESVAGSDVLYRIRSGETITAEELLKSYAASLSEEKEQQRFSDEGAES